MCGSFYGNRLFTATKILTRVFLMEDTLASLMQTYAVFIERVKDIHRLGALQGHLGWDQETIMPAKGAGIIVVILGVPHITTMVIITSKSIISKVCPSIHCLFPDKSVI